MKEEWGILVNKMPFLYYIVKVLTDKPIKGIYRLIFLNKAVKFIIKRQML